ncbi:MAG TPA: rhomboid family intramembrane serine protease [Candidatus Saccharimonadales bacterium]|nr:rhomboid family intramembrane serine protease [Candidatus Saccharimonadales bacterium]
MDDPVAEPGTVGRGSDSSVRSGPVTFDPNRSGRLDEAQARALIARADELLTTGEFGAAAAHFQRVIGVPNAELTAVALYGLGTALFRMDHEDQARATFEQILALPETPYTYRAWRELAAMRVRDGDLRGAQQAYRQAERRAPPQDRAEIASRLGWLAKETGDARGARRYFARSRATTHGPILTIGIIALTVVVSIIGFGNPQLFAALELNKIALAHGEYWRLFTVTLLHVAYLHLFFNMYALYLAGTLVEQIYGWKTYLLIYLLSAAAGSVGSFLFSGDVPSVGASGAIFGLFGILLVVSRRHHPVLGRRSQALLGQIGILIVINLLFGFGLNGLGGGNIDNFAHVGGLVAGLWLGFVLVPGGVPTLGSMWQHPTDPTGIPAASPSVSAPPFLRTLGVLALVVAIVLGVAIGTQARSSGTASGTTVSVVSTRPG